MSEKEVLNQEEVDALLTSEGQPKSKKGVDVNNANIKSYDFSNPDKVTRERLPALEIISEKFARNSRISFFNFIRRNVEIHVEDLEIKKFGDYMRSLTAPTSINLVRMSPLKGTSLIILEPKLVYILVDNYFGGNGKLLKKIETHEFTPSELRVIRLLLNVMFEDIKKSWKDILDLDPSYYASEINPSMANVVNPSDIIVISNFSVEIDGGGGRLQVAIPYAMLDPIRDKLKIGISRDRDEDIEWIGSVKNEIKDVKVNVKCDLAKSKIKLGDVVTWKEGSIIPIKIADTLEMAVNGVPTFECKHGIINGKIGLQVLGKLKIL